MTPGGVFLGAVVVLSEMPMYECGLTVSYGIGGDKSLSLYCSECDKVHAFPPFRDKPKKCPECGSQLCFYTRIEEAPVRRRCVNCSHFEKVTCGITSFTAESIFYPTSCDKFSMKSI